MKLLFVSLGCDKNLVDSEEMLGLLTTNGFEIVDDETEAEAIIVNTCCFINDAKEESVNTILEMAEYKKSGSCKVLIVTGCMAQRYKNEIIDEVPEVDAVLGTTSYGDILKAVNEAMEGKHFQEFKDIDYLPEKLGKRVLTTGSRSQKAVTNTVPTASSRNSAADSEASRWNVCWNRHRKWQSRVSKNSFSLHRKPQYTEPISTVKNPFTFS